MNAVSREIYMLLWCLCKQALTSEDRKSILDAVADALVANEDQIMAENDADVELAQASGISKALIGRLTIKPGKVTIC